MNPIYTLHEKSKIKPILLNYKIRKSFKKIFVKCAFPIIARVLKHAAKWDKDIKKEVDSWEETFTFMIKVNQGPSMAMEKRKGGLRYIGSADRKASLIIYLKNVETAFLIFTFKISLPQGIAEHRISNKGEVSRAMSLNRCLSKIQGWFLKRKI